MALALCQMVCWEQGAKGPQVRPLNGCDCRTSERGWRWQCPLPNALAAGSNGKAACRTEWGEEEPETKGPRTENCHSLSLVMTPIQFSSEVFRTSLANEWRGHPVPMFHPMENSKSELKFWLSCHRGCVTLINNFNCSCLALCVEKGLW